MPHLVVSKTGGREEECTTAGGRLLVPARGGLCGKAHDADGRTIDGKEEEENGGSIRYSRIACAPRPLFQETHNSFLFHLLFFFLIT